MTIFVGADHRGYQLKKKILGLIKTLGHEPVDVGTHIDAVDCDYPQISYDVATRTVRHKDSRGILLCMTGIGHSIAANKVPGARAALVYNKEVAALARQHNDSNILVIGARFMDELTVMDVIKTWLGTAFETGGRHERRVKAIQEIEREFLK